MHKPMQVGELIISKVTFKTAPDILKFEYIKSEKLPEDSCNASQDHNDAFAQYATMRDALNMTGRPIYFSLCGWNSWYAPVGGTLGNSWSKKNLTFSVSK